MFQNRILTKNLVASAHNTTSPKRGKETAEGSSTVRFASVNEEIEPAHSLEDPESQKPGIDEAKLKELSKSLHGTHLQERRMSRFGFEPVSLPASRVRYIYPLFSKHRGWISIYPEGQERLNARTYVSRPDGQLIPTASSIILNSLRCWLHSIHMHSASCPALPHKSESLPRSTPQSWTGIYVSYLSVLRLTDFNFAGHHKRRWFPRGQPA